VRTQDIDPIEMLKQQTLQDAADAISEPEMRSETKASLSRQGSLDLTLGSLSKDPLENAACTATHPEREGASGSSISSSSGARAVAHNNTPQGNEDGSKGGISEGCSPPDLLPPADASDDRSSHGLGLGANACASHPDSSPPRAPPSCMGQVDKHIDR
jgi:hypothetical protein